MPRNRNQNILLLTACTLLLIGSATTGWQLMRPWPIHRWESALVSEGYRVAAGLPVYEVSETGHATHMYGPLTTYVLGQAFRSFGPGLLVGRLLSLLCLALAAAALIRATCPPSSWLPALVVLGVICAFGRAACDYVDPRPDCSSLLLSVLTLVVLYQAHTRRCLRLLTVGCGLLVAAFLLKQTAAMVAAIPVVACGLHRDVRWNLRTLTLLCLPFAALGLTLLVLRFGFPLAWHYMVEVPAAYRIDATEAVYWLIWFAGVTAFAWLPGLPAVRLRVLRQRVEPKTAWLIAAVCVSVPCGVMTAAKTGGMANGLLPALFAVCGLFLHCAPALQLNSGIATRARSFNPTTICAAALLLTLMLTRLHGNSLNNAFGDEGFGSAVRLARQLSGTVVSPQDPSVTVLAKGRSGRSLILEYDAAGWPTRIPRYFFDEIDAADHVITLAEDWRAWPLSHDAFEGLLIRQGFRRIPSPLLAGSVYRCWSRPPGGTAE